MKYFVIFFLVFIATSCLHKNKESEFKGKYKPVDIAGVEIYPTIESDHLFSIRISSQGNKQFKFSEIVEEFYYIPLETTPESLMDQYKEVSIHNDRFYVYDITTKMIFIYDRNGKYINKVGKKGNGPSEFVLLKSMAINPYNNQLVVYDQMWGKLFYFTLDGEFLYTRRMPLRCWSDFCYLSPNKIAFANPKSLGNTHLGELDDYRVIYTDSCLNVIGAAFKYDDTVVGNYGHAEFTHDEKNTIFNPHYTSSFYKVLDTELEKSFYLDYTDFPQMNDTIRLKELPEEKRADYHYSATYALTPVLCTNNFIWFKTHMKSHQDEFYSYYDKRTKKIRSFKESDIEGDIDFTFNSVISTSKDFFIGYVHAESLKLYKAYLEQKSHKMNPEISQMIDGLLNDDNDILVLFKLKSIE